MTWWSTKDHEFWHFDIRTRSNWLEFSDQTGSNISGPQEGLRRKIAALQSEIDEQKQAEKVLDRFFAESLDMLCVADFQGYCKLRPGNQHLVSHLVR